MQKTKSKTGFTLIELLVVIAIIGLLASVALVALNSTRQKARDAKRVADVNQISKAFELFFNSNFTYPTSASACNITSTGGCLSNLVPGYLASLPTAPTPADSGATYNCASAYGSGVANDYQFSATSGSTAANFTVTFCLGGSAGGLSPGIHTLTQGGMR